MTLCISCKNKNSKDRCESNSLPGLLLCGRHAKSRKPRLWTVVNDVAKNVILISKVWRGYHVRNLIKLAGPGAIKRSLCNNTEELVSMEPMISIPIFDYFGFEENNKIYGFDIKSIIECCQRDLIPINPYTRQPLSIDARKRLRQLIGYRTRHKLDKSYENIANTTLENIISNKWLQICQICEENGFFNIPHDLFVGLNASQLYILLSMISNDMKTWAWSAKHKTIHSKRFLYTFWIKNVLRKFPEIESSAKYSFYVSSTLLSILYDSVDAYSICFIIMSALYRL